ncbi:hypothetical protein K8R62_01485 [bacterium]|nr:hypothetical protein [bacterium]
MPTKKSKTTKEPKNLDVEINKAVAALSYIWILFLIPLLLKRKSEFAQFHAKQGMMMFLLSLLTIIPLFGQLLFFVLLIVSVVSIVKVVNGEWWEIPFVYDWSKKFNI